MTSTPTVFCTLGTLPSFYFTGKKKRENRKITKPGPPRPKEMQNPVLSAILQNPVLRAVLQNPVPWHFQNPVPGYLHNPVPSTLGLVLSDRQMYVYTAGPQNCFLL